ncbi:MAG: Flp1 family type IVb pilin [Eubacteriales bacterium]
MRKNRINIKEIISQRDGAAEIIAVIVLVAIAIILGIAFREQIGELLSELWNAIKGRERELISDFEL